LTNLNTLNTFKISNATIDTPKLSYSHRGNAIKVQKPNLFYRERAKLET
jgi:hypothetical protein